MKQIDPYLHPGLQLTVQTKWILKKKIFWCPENSIWGRPHTTKPQHLHCTHSKWRFLVCSKYYRLKGSQAMGFSLMWELTKKHMKTTPRMNTSYTFNVKSPTGKFLLPSANKASVQVNREHQVGFARMGCFFSVNSVTVIRLDLWLTEWVFPLIAYLPRHQSVCHNAHCASQANILCGTDVHIGKQSKQRCCFCLNK